MLSVRKGDGVLPYKKYKVAHLTVWPLSCFDLKLGTS